MPSLDHALLFGASGLIGSHVLRQALAGDGVRRVTAVSRRPLPVQDAKLVNLVDDMAKTTAPAGMETAEVAFCCLGTTMKQAGSRAAFRAVDHDLVMRCAIWARQCGVRHFLVVSAIGASASSPVFYNRVKAETEADLVAMGFDRLSIFQPSLLAGERDGPARPGEAIGTRVAPLLAPLLAGPLSAYKPVAGADVAAAMLAQARQPAGPAVSRLRWRDFMALTGHP